MPWTRGTEERSRLLGVWGSERANALAKPTEEKLMKLIALAAALAIGGTAVAQQTPQTSTTTGQDTVQTAPTTTTDTPMPTSQSQAQPSTAGTTGAGTTSDTGTTGTADTGTTTTTTAPTTGTTDTGTSTTGTTATTPDMAAAAPAPTAQRDYPLCSRTVKDQCRQRGGR
jgi:hypothetical protein